MFKYLKELLVILVIYIILLTIILYLITIYHATDNIYY